MFLKNTVQSYFAHTLHTYLNKYKKMIEKLKQTACICYIQIYIYTFKTWNINQPLIWQSWMHTWWAKNISFTISSSMTEVSSTSVLTFLLDRRSSIHLNRKMKPYTGLKNVFWQSTLKSKRLLLILKTWWSLSMIVIFLTKLTFTKEIYA